MDFELIKIEDLLYPEAIWQLPSRQNPQIGEILILAGSMGRPKAALILLETVLKMARQKPLLAYPDKLNIDKFIPEGLSLKLPSTSSGSIASSSMEQLHQWESFFKTVIIGDDVGGNSETLGIIENLIQKTKLKKIIYGESLKAVFLNPSVIKSSSQTTLVMTTRELFRLYYETKRPIKSGEDSVKYKAEVAYEIAHDYNCNIVLIDHQIYVVSANQVGFTKIGNRDISRHRDVFVGLCAVMIESGKNDFKSLATAAHIIQTALAQLEKVTDRRPIDQDLIGELKKTISQLE